MNKKVSLFLLFICLIAKGGLGQTQDSELAEDLGQKTQNPLADMVLIPIQNNISFDNTQNNSTGYTLNIQPVFPIKGEKISIINRIVFGLGYMPGITAGGSDIPIGYPDEGEVD